jgi:hypothetical protein
MNTRVLWALAAGLLLAGCENVQLEPRFKGVPRFGEEKTEAQKLQEEAGRQVEAFQRDLEKQLGQLDAEIRRLQQAASNKSDDAQQDANRAVKDLEAKKSDLEAQLQAAGKAGEQALKDIEKAIQNAIKQAKATTR